MYCRYQRMSYRQKDDKGELYIKKGKYNIKR